MAGKKKPDVKGAAKKAVEKAASSVRRKPTKDEKAVAKMGLTGGSKVVGANLLQANRNPKEAKKEFKRLNPSKKTAKKK